MKGKNQPEAAAEEGSLFLAGSLTASEHEGDIVMDGAALAALITADLIVDFVGDQVDLDGLLDNLPALPQDAMPLADGGTGAQAPDLTQGEEIVAGLLDFPSIITILYADSEGSDGGTI